MAGEVDASGSNLRRRRSQYEDSFIVSTDDAETIYNVVRLANVGVKKGDDVSLFMLGKGVLFQQSDNEQFKIMEQVQQFAGDFYV